MARRRLLRRLLTRGWIVYKDERSRALEISEVPLGSLRYCAPARNVSTRARIATSYPTLPRPQIIPAATAVMTDVRKLSRAWMLEMCTSSTGGRVRSPPARRRAEQGWRERRKPRLSGDLDEFALAALAGAPVDAYGVGTSVVTGSGAPTAGFIYKLVEVEGRPVVKRSEDKSTRGGRKTAVRRHRSTGTATAEVVRSQGVPTPEPGDRPLQVPLVRAGVPVDDVATLSESREQVQAAIRTLPWEGLKLSRGEPAIPTIHEEPQ